MGEGIIKLTNGGCKMYKVMVIEDEMVIRQGIIGLIDWQSLDCSIVRECSNGQEALDYLNNNDVDILVTDIRMPKMDGLVLLEKLQLMNKSLKPIVLTAYSQFSYAQQALRYGAVDFIIKNDFVDELPKAISKAVTMIEEDAKEYNKDLTQQEDLSMDMIMHESLINPDYQITQQVVKGHDHQLYCVCALECGLSILQDIDDDESKYQMEKVLHICFSEFNYHFIVTQERQWFLVIEIKDGIDLDQIKQCCNQCIHMAGQLMDLSLIIGMTTNTSDVKGLYELGKEAVSALEKCWSQENSYSIYNGQGNANLELFSIDLPENVIELLFAHHENQALSSFSHWEEEMVKASMPIHGSKMLVLRFCAVVLRRLHHYDEVHHVSLLEKNILDAVEKAKSLYTLFGICRELMIATNKLMEQKGHVGSYMIHNIDIFIKDNYCNNITLEAISRELHVSKSYLSRIYKKKTGITISDAINRYRIKQGKKLLMESRQKIYEISDAIGYDDPAYFTHIFKKYEGCSPTEFRNSSI